MQEVSQPAIFVCSMAAVEKLRLEKGDVVLDEATCAMGLSLGEYSALCFAGAITFEDGVKVTKARFVRFLVVVVVLLMCTGLGPYGDIGRMGGGTTFFLSKHVLSDGSP